MKASTQAKDLVVNIEILERIRDAQASTIRDLRGGNAIFIRRDGFRKTMMIGPHCGPRYSLMEEIEPHEIFPTSFSETMLSCKEIHFDLQRGYDDCGRAVYLEV